MEKLKPVGKQEIIDLFKGKKFKALLRRAAIHTFRTGHESGFLVVRDITDNELHYSNLVKGNTDSVYGLRSARVPRLGSELHNENIYTFLDLHFHPGIEEYVCPSIKDLMSYTNLKENIKVKFMPISAVGQIDDNDKGELILLQEKYSKPLTKTLINDVSQNIDELTTRCLPSTQDIVNLFNQTGLYKAQRLEFILDEPNIIMLDSDLEKLGVFSYIPTLKY